MLNKLNITGMSRKVGKMAAAVVIATVLATSPMMVEMLWGTDATPTAYAGRAQTGPGEY